MNDWTIVAAMAAAIALEGAQGAIVQESGFVSHTEASIMAGAQAVDHNDTALPDRFVNIPAVGALAYHISPNLAAEGEFAWLIPVKQSVDLGAAGTQDRRTPDVLSYMGNLRASWPLSGWTPYLTAGLGAVTFLSTSDADRVPQLAASQTAFAIDMGAGATYGLGARWALRGDFRSLAAFPSRDTPGLSSSGNADAIWMERLTAGLAYHF